MRGRELRGCSAAQIDGFYLLVRQFHSSPFHFKAKCFYKITDKRFIDDAVKIAVGAPGFTERHMNVYSRHSLFCKKLISSVVFQHTGKIGFGEAVETTSVHVVCQVVDFYP